MMENCNLPERFSHNSLLKFSKDSIENMNLVHKSKEFNIYDAVLKIDNNTVPVLISEVKFVDYNSQTREKIEFSENINNFLRSHNKTKSFLNKKLGCCIDYFERKFFFIYEKGPDEFKLDFEALSSMSQVNAPFMAAELTLYLANAASALHEINCFLGYFDFSLMLRNLKSGMRIVDFSISALINEFKVRTECSLEFVSNHSSGIKNDTLLLVLFFLYLCENLAGNIISVSKLFVAFKADFLRKDSNFTSLQSVVQKSNFKLVSDLLTTSSSNIPSLSDLEKTLEGLKDTSLSSMACYECEDSKTNRLRYHHYCFHIICSSDAAKHKCEYINETLEKSINQGIDKLYKKMSRTFDTFYSMPRLESKEIYNYYLENVEPILKEIYLFFDQVNRRIAQNFTRNRFIGSRILESYSKIRNQFHENYDEMIADHKNGVLAKKNRSTLKQKLKEYEAFLDNIQDTIDTLLYHHDLHEMFSDISQETRKFKAEITEMWLQDFKENSSEIINKNVFYLGTEEKDMEEVADNVDKIIRMAAKESLKDEPTKPPIVSVHANKGKVFVYNICDEQEKKIKIDFSEINKEAGNHYMLAQNCKWIALPQFTVVTGGLIAKSPVKNCYFFLNEEEELDDESEENKPFQEHKAYKIAPMNCPRESHAMVQLNPIEVAAISGGTERCEKYNILSDTWTELPPLNHERKHPSVCLVNNDTLYLFFGINDECMKNAGFNLPIEKLSLNNSIVQDRIAQSYKGMMPQAEAKWEIVPCIKDVNLDFDVYQAAILQTEPNEIIIMGGHRVINNRTNDNKSSLKFLLEENRLTHHTKLNNNLDFMDCQFKEIRDNGDGTRMWGIYTTGNSLITINK